MPLLSAVIDPLSFAGRSVLKRGAHEATQCIFLRWTFRRLETTIHTMVVFATS